MSVNRSVGPSVTSRRGPGRPSVISRELIREAALRIVDTDGLEALTMRRLGAELGVDPMAAYRHFPNKVALFDGVVEQLLAEVRIPDPGEDWWASFSGLVRALRAACLAHPHAVPLLATRPPTTGGAFVVIEAGLSILLAAGFSAQRSMDAVDVAARLVVGHVLAERAESPAGLPGGEAEHQDAQEQLPEQRFPALAAVTRGGIRHDPARLFDLALEGLRLSLRT